MDWPSALPLLVFLAVIGLSLAANLYDDRAGWITPVSRIALFVAIAGLFVQSGLAMRGQKEFERVVLLESAAIALAAVLATALVLGALDELDVLRPPSPWLYWNVGVVAWFVSKLVLIRLRT
jgi:hypothetical protein